MPENFTVDPETGLVKLGPVEPGINDELGFWEEQLTAALAAGATEVDLREAGGDVFWKRLAEICRQLGLNPKTR